MMMNRRRRRRKRRWRDEDVRITKAIPTVLLQFYDP
jgi:hypothetical protein